MASKRRFDVTDELPNEPGGNGNGHGSFWDPKKKTPFRPDNPKRIHSTTERLRCLRHLSTLANDRSSS